MLSIILRGNVWIIAFITVTMFVTKDHGDWQEFTDHIYGDKRCKYRIKDVSTCTFSYSISAM